MSLLKAFIESMALVIPVKWDRFTDNGGNIFVYGWIARKDGDRDFVVLDMTQKKDALYCNTFVTSSAKYSREIMKHIYGNDESHTDCKKISEL